MSRGSLADWNKLDLYEDIQASNTSKSLVMTVAHPIESQSDGILWRRLRTQSVRRTLAACPSHSCCVPVSLSHSRCAHFSLWYSR